MYAAAPLLLVAVLGALAAPATVSEFGDLSVRTIQFANEHIERLPIGAIESLRFAPALPRPLSSDSLNAARASIANISILTATTISDEAIEELQGRYERKLWGPGYVDITDSPSSSSIRSRAVVAPNYPTPNPSAHPELSPMLAMVTAAEIKSSTNARAPAAWIQSQFASWLGSSQSKFAENSFSQPNVIGRIEAKSGSASAGIVILGGHLDSTSQSASTSAPGADDDASGVAAMMAIMRILKANNYQGTYAIEAHAYAGEEGGLLGAKALAASYKSAGKTVRGMLDFEMIGYQPNTSSSSGKSSTITVLSDPVTAMSTHMTNVVKAYVPTAERRSVSCGYGCSDHYAFYDAGYPVVCIAAYGPNDANLNPNYHRTTDTIDKLNFDKAADFVKAGLAWVVEVAA
ncbi:Leucine aminopeptidase A [Rhizoctonia solani]|uniref:Peptide hydrolase n=1 Tax=Rhizoctonia solani TaxID=456999 RepID=A0A0K6FLJ9_9AGAM|nr:Leucine aminopeptidase A [Rhizoctonia solani]